MLAIRPVIRLVVLGSLFFIIFLNLVTYINSVSSLRTTQNNYTSQKEQAIVNKRGFESDALKEVKNEVNSKHTQQNFVRIDSGEIKRPIDLQKNLSNSGELPVAYDSVEIGLIGR